MNNEEAKFILSAYRLGGQDASDRRFLEALEQVHRDPEVAKWFTEQRAFDQAVRRQLLAATPVPSNLRTTLLAARNIVRPTPWWHRYAWITAAAACFVAIITSVYVWKDVSNRSKFAGLIERLAHTSATEAGHVTVESDNFADIQRWIAERNGVETFQIPNGLKKWIPMGCRIVDWQEMRVAMICWHDGKKQHVDLFVGNLAPGMPLKSTPKHANVDGRSLVSWRAGNRFYVLAGADGVSLAKLL